jgi:hypothetical protein
MLFNLPEHIIHFEVKHGDPLFPSYLLGDQAWKGWSQLSMQAV